MVQASIYCPRLRQLLLIHSNLSSPSILCSSGNSIEFDALQLQDQIGGGGHSLVYRGLWNGTPVAVKQWFNPDHSDEVVQECRYS